MVQNRQPAPGRSSDGRSTTTAIWSRQSYLGWNSLYMIEFRFSTGVNSASLWVSRQVGSRRMRGTFSLSAA